MLLPRLPVTVESEATVLFVVDSPVDSDVMPVEVDVESDTIELLADDNPVDVEVDNDATLLFVVDNPVDSDVMPVEVDVDSDAIELVAVDRPVDVDVDNEPIVLVVVLSPAYSCEPLIASVLVAVTRPAATFVIWRSLPTDPTLTTLAGFVPAKL
ncbi:hypothetical protein WL08_12240 [Burkholderia ubonensis]|nr:hypothetical protein WL08_12240 [Burkholderia ubonensis]